MKQITITVPDNCELKQDGNTYTIVEKEKLTYEDIAKELFKCDKAHYTCSSGIIQVSTCASINPINCTSQKQAEKLLAINKLMNVAKYLNDGWQPDFDCKHDYKYYIALTYDILKICNGQTLQCGDIYFKSRELAEKAIEILGEETIKLALCTDY